MAHLSLEERQVIATRLFAGESQQSISQELGRSPSTISREIKRNQCCDGRYRCLRAHRHAIERRMERDVVPKMEQPDIYDSVVEKLLLFWSPQQISGYLKAQHGRSIISHETIYSYLWCLDKKHPHRRALRRGGRRPRKAKPGFLARAARDRVSIHDRPVVVGSRARTGDWELDLMTCHRASGYLITAVERRTGYLLMRKVSSKHAGKVSDGIVQLFGFIDDSIIKTFTFDNGSEFYYHGKLTRKLGAKVYFADPYNSGQRGTNENTNGLIRQYFPKTLSYDQISHQAVRKAQDAINDRPRLRHKYQTPATILGKHPQIAFQI